MTSIVSGAELRFYGIVLLGHQYRSVALTPALSCIAATTEGWERKALYNAFSAASVLLARIHQDARRFVTSLPPEIPDGTHHFPAGKALVFLISRSTHSMATGSPLGSSSRLVQRVPIRLS